MPRASLRAAAACPQAEQIKASGINWHGETACAKIEALPSGEKHVTLKSGEAIACDQVMFATGRRPNTRSLGLENAGVEVGPMGNVIVDKFSRTTCESVWAVGDVTNRKNLTPVATMEGMALAATLFRGQPTAPQYDNVATAVFTQPPIGTVGLTEEQAVASIGACDTDGGLQRCHFRARCILRRSESVVTLISRPRRRGRLHDQLQGDEAHGQRPQREDVHEDPRRRKDGQGAGGCCALS